MWIYLCFDTVTSIVALLSGILAPTRDYHGTPVTNELRPNSRMGDTSDNWCSINLIFLISGLEGYTPSNDWQTGLQVR